MICQSNMVAAKTKPMMYYTEKLRCPVCGGRVIDGRQGLKSMLYDIANTNGVDIDFIAKCGKCHKDIGIKKI